MPSCTVLPAEAPNAAPLYINVDGHGRFFSTQVAGSIGSNLVVSRSYHSSDELQRLCDQTGLPIAFWGVDNVALRPTRYVDLVEFVLPTASVPNYFLSANSEDTAFVQSGKAGSGWAATPLRMRIPRVSVDLVPVHRFLGGDEVGTVTHFYTADPVEVATWRAKAALPATASRWWNDEGIVFHAPTPRVESGKVTCADAGLTPVYRVRGVGAGKSQPKYRYVGNASAIIELLTRGYELDAPAFCALND